MSYGSQWVAGQEFVLQKWQNSQPGFLLSGIIVGDRAGLIVQNVACGSDYRLPGFRELLSNTGDYRLGRKSQLPVDL
jgi:hypothetical protein